MLWKRSLLKQSSSLPFFGELARSNRETRIRGGGAWKCADLDRASGLIRAPVRRMKEGQPKRRRANDRPAQNPRSSRACGRGAVRHGSKSQNSGSDPALISIILDASESLSESVTKGAGKLHAPFV